MFNVRRNTIRVRHHFPNRRNHWNKHWDAEDAKAARKRRGRLPGLTRSSDRFFCLWLNWRNGTTWSA